MVRIVFLHPDLGIGGAERLVVDAALAFKERGHEVSFLTNHHDPTHCFKETTDGTFPPVEVVGDWLPRKLFGRFNAFCAYMRMLYAAFYVSFCLSQREKIDIIFCDLISIGIPVLSLAKSNPKILYYCHFPDQLLSVPEGALKRIYRWPLNYLEEYTIGLSDKIMVNSKFTLRVFCETFRRLDVIPEVLYPSLNTKYFDEMLSKVDGQNSNDQKWCCQLLNDIPRNAFIFLDINRYERKKNHALAIKAFSLLAAKLLASEFKQCRLVLAGGYDKRVIENVEHYEELKSLAKELQIHDQVLLLRSPKDDEKFQLLHAAHCLLYTPENEHFGIVPLEGMYMSKPIIASNSGGPMETVVNNSTGFLCENRKEKFAEAMLQIFKDEMLRERMGVMGRKRVQQKFSFEIFSEKLDSIVKETLRSGEETIPSKKEQ